MTTYLRSITHLSRSALILVAGLLLSACSGSTTPEAALRSQLQEMQTAASEGRPADFMQGITDDFVGNAGTDRAALHNLLRMQALGKSRIGVTTGPLDVQMQGDRATVRFTAVLTGGSGRLLPDSVQSYSITSGWRMQDDEWHVYYAQWEPNL
ncbi:MAG TPA: hypothetical protein VET30_03660 [Pseudoxanthomonas sp.]|nr:hypothetical protein [Pseudoxanthomonas sp.]